MTGIQLIKKYFPALDQEAEKQFVLFGQLFPQWNNKINLVSRKDIDQLFERHLLHSLAIARFIRFKPGTRVMDLGTGGGFPGLPLAILFPDVTFTLVDSISKKMLVVSDLINNLGLKNAEAVTGRAEELNGSWDYVVSRAAAPLSDLYKWGGPHISKTQKNAIPNGIICLKGGDLTDELRPFRGRLEVVELSDFFEEEYFMTKKLIFLMC